MEKRSRPKPRNEELKRMAAEIDPVRYGVLWQKVEDYERRFEEIGRAHV